MGSIFNPNDNFLNGVVDQSNLTTFVNLTVSLPERLFDKYTIPKEDTIMKLNHNKQFGTSYVDINLYENGEIKNPEMFGINSIDFSFNTSFHPVVKIHFTDVKGYNLFNKNEKGEATIFFKSFFHFPYPKFTLKLKGYYGPPVSFDLKVLNFDSEFISDTGNYNITVEFIGDVYGILGDIPVTFLLMSPYNIVEENKVNVLKTKALWDNHVGKSKDILGFKCPTLIELVEKINNLSNENFGENERMALQVMFNNHDSIGNLELVKDLISEINNITTLIQNIVRNIKDNTSEHEYNSEYYKDVDGEWDVYDSIVDTSTGRAKYKYIFAEHLHDASYLKQYSDICERISNIDLSTLGETSGSAIKETFEEMGVFTIDELAKLSGVNAKTEIDTYYSEQDICSGIKYFLKKNLNKIFKGCWNKKQGTDIDVFADQEGFYTQIKTNGINYSINLHPAFEDIGIGRYYSFCIDVENFKNVSDNGVREMLKFLNLDTNHIIGGTFLQVRFNNETMEERTIYKVHTDRSWVANETTKWITIGENCKIIENKAPEFINGDNIIANLNGYIRERHKKVSPLNEELKNKRIIRIPTNINFDNIKAVVGEINEKIKQIREIEKLSTKALSVIINNHIGFRPTIKNLSKIVFCNLDFFIKEIIELTNRIIKQMGGRNFEPSNGVMCDYSGGKIPPFPMVAINENENGINENCKVFPGTLKYFEKISEVLYVNDMYKKITFYRDKVNNDRNNNEEVMVNFTKVLPIDMFYENNPYYTSSTEPYYIYNHITTILGKRLVHCDYYYKYEADAPTLGYMIKSEWENLIKPVIEYYDDVRLGNLFVSSDSLLNNTSFPVSKMLNGEFDNMIDPYSQLFVGKIENTREKFSELYIKNEGDYEAFPSIYNLTELESEDGKYSLSIDKDEKEQLEDISERQRYEFLAYTILYNKIFEGHFNDKNNILENVGDVFNFIDFEDGIFICETRVLWLLRIGCYLYFKKKNNEENLSENDKKFYQIFDNIGIYKSINLETGEYNEKCCIDLFEKWITYNGTVNIGGGAEIFSLKQLFKIDNNKVIKICTNQQTSSEKEPLAHKAYVYMYPNKINRDRVCKNMNSIAFNTIINGVGALRLSDAKQIEKLVSSDVSFQSSVKSSLYYSLKHIFDNYINYLLENYIKKTLFTDEMNINCIDSYMNNIDAMSFVDLKIVANIIKESYEETPSLSVLQLLTKIGEKNKYLTILGPLNLLNGNIREMFEIKTPYEEIKDMSRLLIFYKYNEDSFLSEGSGFEKNTMDDVTNYPINAFEVSYGDNKNNIFYGISMNMNGSVSTEESIANTLLLSRGGTNNTTLNLYDVFKERSYKVNLTMMGNPNITPMMFFSLKHIPMYNGIYRIINVSHNITPNNFITHITGIGVNKYSRPKENETSLIYNFIKDFVNKVRLNSSEEITFKNYRDKTEILKKVINNQGNNGTQGNDSTQEISTYSTDIVRHVDEVNCDDINSMIEYIRRNANVSGNFAIDNNIVQKSLLYMLCRLIKHWNREENTKITITSLLRRGVLKNGRTTYGSAHDYGLAADIQILKSGRPAREENLNFFKIAIKYLGTNYESECNCDVDRVIWEYKPQWDYKDSYPQWIHIGMSSGDANKIYGVDVNSAYMGNPKKLPLAGIQDRSTYTSLTGERRPSGFVEACRNAGFVV